MCVRDTPPCPPPSCGPRSWPASQSSTESASLKAWGETLDLETTAAAMRRWPMEGAGPGQWPRDWNWATWLFLGGRGAGKTRAGAEWLTLRSSRAAGRFALVGPALHVVREVMIEGPSGLRAIAQKGGRPTYSVSRRRLEWPNGAVAFAFSAEDVDSLRGPQFSAAWADEFCAWPRPGDMLAQLRLGLRLGKRPQLAVTTTPRPTAALRRLIAAASTEVTRATTADNAAHLAPDFLDGLRALYGGTRLEQQELEGRVVQAHEGALWRAEEFARLRRPAPPALERVVVAVDPPAGLSGAACGIVAAGRADGVAYVLADASVRGLTLLGWAARVARLAAQVGAHAVVAEANQGGEMVRSVLTTAGCPAPIRLVHARLGKRARAEPVAALYEQGRVVHCGAFEALEEELTTLGGDSPEGGKGGGGPSPDRADALVWAVTALLLGAGPPEPRVRAM